MPNGMSTARMRAITRFSLWTAPHMLWGLLLGACGPEADTIVPSVVETRPEAGTEWPADVPMTVVFDQWLEPGSVADGVVELRSGELTASVWVEYDPVAPGLVVHPFFPLRAGLGYVLTVDGAALEALGGGAADGAWSVGFRAGPAVGWAAPPIPSDAEMADLFAGRCGCHGPEPAVFPPLTRAGLVGAASRRRPGRSLVARGRPMQSELVLRVLADYPGVLGMQKALSDDERRRIIRWVQAL